MLRKNVTARMVGYGSMLMRSAVAVMALIAAVILTPGLYFSINVAPAALGTAGVKDFAEAAATLLRATVAGALSSRLEDILGAAKEVGKPTILSKTGGAPTFAIGMAMIIAEVPLFNQGSVAFWYHFAILFEALFVLPLLMRGWAGRFMVQDVLGNVYKPIGNILGPYFWGIVATLICVAGWGYILYQGVTESTRWGKITMDTLWCF